MRMPGVDSRLFCLIASGKSGVVLLLMHVVCLVTEGKWEEKIRACAYLFVYFLMSKCS